MQDKVFIDSNVLIYAFSKDNYSLDSQLKKTVKIQSNQRDIKHKILFKKNLFF